MPIVHFVDGEHDLGFDPNGSCDAGQGTHIFGKTTAAVAATGKQEREADPLIVTDAAPDIVDVPAHSFTYVGHFVDKADFG